MSVDISSIKQTQADHVPSAPCKPFIDALKHEFSREAVLDTQKYLREHSGDWNGRIGDFYNRVTSAYKSGGEISGADQHYLIERVQSQALRYVPPGRTA